MRHVIVLLGGPGAGKGTQARFITDWLKIPHISTGELLRSEVEAQTPLGVRAQAAMDAGGLVGDDIVNQLLVRRIARPDCEHGFLLDGYPRDVDQAVELSHCLGAGNVIVVDIDSDLDQLIPRLTGRRSCKSCSAIYHTVSSPPSREGVCDRCGDALVQRADDREEVIRRRFNTYRDKTKPLTDFYAHYGVYHRVEGMNSAEQVAHDVRRVLETELPQFSEAVPRAA